MAFRLGMIVFRKRVLVLDERHKVHVVLAADDEDALDGVTVRMGVHEDIEQVAALDAENDASNMP